MSDGPPPPISMEEILAAVGLGVMASDLSGAVVYWNQAAQELYGWTALEAVGRQVEELTAPQIDRKAAHEMEAARRDGVPWSGGLPVQRKDGTVFPALITDRGIYRDGQLVGLVGLTASLGSALRPLLDRSTEAALVLRADGVVAYASPSVSPSFGWQEPIVGSSFMPLVHPDERPTLTALMRAVTDHPADVRSVADVRVRTTGGWAWAEAALTNMLDDAQVRGLVCCLRRSPWREAYESAERLAEQLETALDSRTIIEQAKGFLAGRHGIAPDEGFERLRGYARSRNLTIQQVAAEVVAGDIDLLTG